MAESKRTTKKVIERSPSKLKYVVGVVVLIVASFGVAYALGTSDSGQIDVNESIVEDREQNPGNTTGVNTNTRADVPNGGLVGKGDVGEEVTTPPPPVATSTDETASSTEEVGEEGADESVDEGEEEKTLEELSAELAEDVSEESEENIEAE